MTYAAGEALWLTRLRAMSNFDSGNSARGRWGIRNSGKSDHYAILKPGVHNREWLSITVRWDHYQTIIQLWQRYVDDGDTLTDLEALVDAVLAELDKYRLIGDSGGTVQAANIVAVREVQEILAGPGEGPVWLMVELVGEWHEENTIAFAE
jgi:hypothetical protein